MNEGGDATNEPSSSLQRLLRMLLDIVLIGKDTLGSQFLDLRLAVVVPKDDNEYFES